MVTGQQAVVGQTQYNCVVLVGSGSVCEHSTKCDHVGISWISPIIMME